jgi:hypothetical protein
MGRLAIKVKEIGDEDLQASHGKATKRCSGCDPDSPGHVERVFCKLCGGTGQEPLSFCAAFAQLAESRQAAADKAKGGKPGDDLDDDSLYVEY